MCRIKLASLLLCLTISYLSPIPAADSVQSAIKEHTRALQNKDAKARAHAAKALGDLGSPAKTAVPDLVAALQDRDITVRAQVARALGQIGPVAVPALVKTLKTGRVDERVWALCALAGMGPEGRSAVPVLIDQLAEADARIQVSTMMALGSIGPDANGAIPALERLSKAKNEYIALLANMALAKIKGLRGEVNVDVRAPIGVIQAQAIAVREAQMDQLINLFLLADSGQLPGPAENRLAIISTFHPIMQQIGPDAIPALVRGTNRAMLLNCVACPGTTFLNYLTAFIPICTDANKLDYVLTNLGRGVNYDPLRIPSGFTVVYQTIRPICVRRKAELQIMAMRAAVINKLLNQALSLGDADLENSLTAKEPESRWAAIWVIAYRRLHWQDALIDRLADPSPDVREAARQALVRLSRGTDFGPAPNAKPADRDKAIAKWRDWWAMQDDNPKNKKDGGTTLQTADAEDGKQKEADRLAEAAVKGTSQERADALAKLQAGKGGPYTLALSVAIAKLEGDGKAEARRALVERLTRLTAGTLAQYLESEDAELRRAAALALAAKEDTSQVPKLIALLEDREPLAARAAHAALKALAGQDFGPARDATAEQRAEAVKKWRQWWEKQKEGKK